MSNDRVLNFGEFAGKYSSDSEQDNASSLSDFEGASDNFQDGFDETSYEDGKEIKPNRPLSQGSELTPDGPDNGIPTDVEGMESPAEEEETGEEFEEETGEEFEEEEGDEDEDEDFEDEEEEDDDFYDDDGGNPEEEEEDEEDEDEEDDDANESLIVSRHFIQSESILESFESFTQKKSNPYSDVLNKIELDIDDEDDTPGGFVICKSCGNQQEIPRGHNPMDDANIEDPNHWWQGRGEGMQCGCNKHN